MTSPPPLPVDVEAIERELARLWQAAPGVDRRQELALSRTSVLTLFIYAPTQQWGDWVRDVISQLSTAHPSRVVLLISAPELSLQEPQLSIQCHLGMAERYAPCYEQVTISLPSDGLELLPSLLIPLALPDLPAFLWWLGPLPCQDRRFIRVAQAVDRLLFDSLEQAQPLTDLISTRRLVQQVARTTVVTDLNWCRLGPWQETAACLFDLPHCRWALGAIERLHLRYGVQVEHQPNPSQALLYLGWIVSRLGWRLRRLFLKTASEWDFDFGRPDGSSVTVTVRPESVEPGRAGHLLQVQFSARQNERSATFAIELCGSEHATIHMEAREQGRCLLKQAFHYHHLSLQRLLASELQEVAPDQLYEEALDEATGIAVELRRSLSK